MKLRVDSYKGLSFRPMSVYEKWGRRSERLWRERREIFDKSHSKYQFGVDYANGKDKSIRGGKVIA